MHAEEESLSGQRLSKDIYIYIKHPLNHHMLFGRVSRTIILTHPKTNSSKWKLSDTTGTSNGTGFYRHMKLKKNRFLAANPPDEYTMFTVKYTAGSLMLCTCFSARGPGHLVQMHGIMDYIKYQQIKKSKPDCLCLDLPPEQQSKTNIKINTKMGHWAQNESLAVPVLWPEPYRKWVRWTKEKKY